MPKKTQPIESTENKDRLTLTVRVPPDFHRKLIARIEVTGHSINGLMQNLLRRWVDGELDRKTDRPITSAESEEDRLLLRVIHHPVTRDEKLLSHSAQIFLRLLREDEESVSE